jgi:hypothetical protein
MAGNSESPAKRRRGKGRPFVPGQSGNASGRPKLPPDVKAWLTENKGRLTVKALERLEAWIDSGDEKASPAMIRVWLSKVIPDAAIAIELSGPDGQPVSTLDYSKLSVEQLRQLKVILASADPGRSTTG